MNAIVSEQILYTVVGRVCKVDGVNGERGVSWVSEVGCGGVWCGFWCVMVFEICVCDRRVIGV